MFGILRLSNSQNKTEAGEEGVICGFQGTGNCCLKALGSQDFGKKSLNRKNGGWCSLGKKGWEGQSGPSA